jgi:hypothetical protein
MCARIDISGINYDYKMLTAAVEWLYMHKKPGHGLSFTLPDLTGSGFLTGSEKMYEKTDCKGMDVIRRGD